LKKIESRVCLLWFSKAERVKYKMPSKITVNTGAYRRMSGRRTNSKYSTVNRVEQEERKKQRLDDNWQQMLRNCAENVEAARVEAPVVAAAVAAPVAAPVVAVAAPRLAATAPVAERDISKIKSHIIDEYSFNRLRDYDFSKNYDSMSYENFVNQTITRIRNLPEYDYNFMERLSNIIRVGRLKLVDGESCSGFRAEGIYFDTKGDLCIMSSR
jgi:hypothetical protein